MGEAPEDRGIAGFSAEGARLVAQLRNSVKAGGPSPEPERGDEGCCWPIPRRKRRNLPFTAVPGRLRQRTFSMCVAISDQLSASKRLSKVKQCIAVRGDYGSSSTGPRSSGWSGLSLESGSTRVVGFPSTDRALRCQNRRRAGVSATVPVSLATASAEAS